MPAHLKTMPIASKEGAAVLAHGECDLLNWEGLGGDVTESTRTEVDVDRDG